LPLLHGAVPRCGAAGVGDRTEPDEQVAAAVVRGDGTVALDFVERPERAAELIASQ
jgi:hypothetical protein